MNTTSCTNSWVNYANVPSHPALGPSSRDAYDVIIRAFQFAIRIDSIRYANRFESIRFVKKIGLSIH